ncbi:mucin TcMUCII [Trypanosoma cruzi cruzi]|uniref:Putative mucin TcMUCII n=1 Tax=Trypanosoma cruzi TaxID=5693 RepID=A0A2V2V6V6_TRYCR|nr:mucin TcMUCII [Trypanosoma cruzi cruzi]PWU92245.1 putative mucin TcMUCII [Trypanosoma cruzi]
MMTCRLLCALLVLALCCCPSVCVTTDDVKPEVGVEGTGINSSPPESGGQGKDQSQPAAQPVPKPAGEPGKDTVAEKSPKGTVMQSVDPKKTAQTDGTAGTQSDTSISAGQVDKNSKASAETTTTTTTEAPTTTTTTTAPEATSTTTTEASTTTTTRAPSRLREVDGSLSSSAWVCASLLLAASALAYTALG